MAPPNDNAECDDDADGDRAEQAVDGVVLKSAVRDRVLLQPLWEAGPEGDVAKRGQHEHGHQDHPQSEHQLRDGVGRRAVVLVVDAVLDDAHGHLLDGDGDGHEDQHAHDCLRGAARLILLITVFILILVGATFQVFLPLHIV